MRQAAIIFILTFVVTGYSLAQTSENLDNIPELKKTWISFKDAVKSADKNQLKILCADSVIFSMVIGDMKLLSSSVEDISQETIPSDNSMHKNYFYLSFESFFSEELDFVFDSNVKSRMDDLSKLRIEKSKNDNSEYKFYITVTDPDEEFSGIEMALRFKKSNACFQFIGIDTIQ